MNYSPDNSDPFLKSLTEEAADLPILAAGEARRVCAQRKRQRRQIAGIVFIGIFGVCCWQALYPFRQRDVSRGEIGHKQAVPATLASTQSVNVQTLQEAMSEPVAIPPGASEDQKALLEAAHDLPLLLVLDDSGKLKQIHVIGR